MKKCILIVTVFVTSMGFAQKVNFADDIACIIYTHCTRCHNTNLAVGGIVLNNYYDTWSQRNAIKYYTQNKFMPPYMPGTKHTNFAEQKELTDIEIALIKEWVDNGCDSGNLATAPSPPVITNPVSNLSMPDVSVRMPNYNITSAGEIYRQCFVLSTPTSSVEYIDAIEIVPSNISAVYAYYVYADTSTIPQTLDAADTALGYTNFGGTGSPTSKPIFGWVNGSLINYFPPQFPLKIDSGSRYIVQVQYAEDAGGKLDSAQLNIRYFASKPARYLSSEMLLSHENNLLNPPLFIQADSVKDFFESRFVPNDLTVYSITPLSHHICKSMEVYAVSTLNDTTHLFEADECGAIWNQGFYVFDKPKFIPAGSTLYAKAHFDNSMNNENNPNIPPADISSGYNDDDEQMIFYFQTTPHQAGDENLVMDSVPHFNHYLNCNYLNQPTGIAVVSMDNKFSVFPNPTSDFISIVSNFQNGFQYSITDVAGKEIASGKSESSYNTINTKEFANGVYQISIMNGNNISSKKILIQH